MQGPDSQSVNSSGHEGSGSSGKYTPLTALASLQPGGQVQGSVNQDSGSGSGNNSGSTSRFHSSFPSFSAHPGIFFKYRITKEEIVSCLKRYGEVTLELVFSVELICKKN